MTDLPITYTWEVHIADDEGLTLQILDGVSSIAIDHILNGIGVCAVSVPYDSLAVEPGPDLILKVYRSPLTGGISSLEFWGFIRRIEYRDTGNTLLVSLMAVNPVELIKRRIVAYAAGTSNAQASTETIDNLMKRLVAQNLGSSATDADRDLSSAGLSVQPNSSSGPTITKGFAWQPLLKIFQELVEYSVGKNNEVFFRVVVSSDAEATLRFETATGIPGNDLTPGAVPHPIIFSRAFGNLAGASVVYDYTEELTHVYAGGQGEESDRTIIQTYNASASAASQWNRREGFKDARNEETDAGVTAAGYSLLLEFSVRPQFTGTVLSTPQTPYGQWGLGDKVVAEFIGKSYEGLIRQVTIRVSEGTEQISAVVTSDEGFTIADTSGGE